MAAFVPTTNPRPQLGNGNGPDEAVIVPSGAYTATASQEFAVVGECEGVELLINFTKVGAAPSVVFTIECQTADGTWVTMLASAAVIATGTAFLLVSHHAPNVTNVSAAHVIRQKMRVTATHGNTDATTYSIIGSGV